jgi:uncharacterized protein YjbI with pentapeptide repeats
MLRHPHEIWKQLTHGQARRYLWNSYQEVLIVADQKQYKLLKQSVKDWNAWRKAHKDIRPDLSGAEFFEADLFGADLCEANLSRANLTMADLCEANLSDANLNGANLNKADLNKANLSSTDFSEANLGVTVLRDTVLSGANLSRANLAYADLRGADLSKTVGLSQEQVDKMHGSKSTSLPPDFRKPASWG